MDLDTIAEVTWCWGKDFFLETPSGNYVWSCPEYPGGDNTVRPYPKTFQDFLRECKIPFGRCKGKKKLKDLHPDIIICE